MLYQLSEELMHKILGKSILRDSFTNKYLKSVVTMWEAVRPVLLTVILWIVNSFQSRWFACAVVSEEKEASRCGWTGSGRGARVGRWGSPSPGVPFGVGCTGDGPPSRTQCSGHRRSNLPATAWCGNFPKALPEAVYIVQNVPLLTIKTWGSAPSSCGSCTEQVSDSG